MKQMQQFLLKPPLFITDREPAEEKDYSGQQSRQQYALPSVLHPFPEDTSGIGQAKAYQEKGSQEAAAHSEA